MAMKNYYAVLGVAQNETPTGIRAAYRDAVRRTHPDRAGSQAATAFQQIVEANSVLSDPNRRREYNENLGSYDRDRRDALMLHRWPVESEPESIFADAHGVHPSYEALAERLMRNFTGWGISKAERPEELCIEIILTPEEAARGGVLSVGIPVHEVCRTCGGTGREWLFPCLHCGAEGIKSRMQPVEVHVPRSLRMGAAPELSLEALGINNLFLKLKIRISDELRH